MRVPKLQLGNPVPEAQLPDDISPIPNHLNQPLLTGIIARAGIAPMFRPVDIAALDRVPMDIVQLLPHDRLGFDDLRMVAFFPDLVSRVLLVGALEERQQFQQFC